MARPKKAETIRLHGRHEVFNANDREMDLHSGFINCPKHPGHPNFYPFKEFKMEHIPEQHRTEDVYNWIRLSGELTVRVRASFVSEARPLHFADGSDEYPFAEHRGKRIQRFGTGFVTYVALEDKREDEATSESGKSTSEASSESGKSTSEASSESGKSTSEASSESGKSTSEAMSESGKSTSEAMSESGKSTSEASSESGKSTSEASSESGKSTSEAMSESGKSTSEATTGVSTTSNPNQGKRVRIAISTSTHVVFNVEETQGMKVDFFYDSGDKTQTQNMKTLEGPFKLALSTVVGDWFEFICHTEDFELFTKLNDSLNGVGPLEAKLSKDSTIHDIAAVVSHPHGSHKHVTVGQLLPAEPFITGGSILLSRISFHPENYCLFNQNSKLTFGKGSEVNLPDEIMKMLLPDGTKCDILPYKTQCKVRTVFEFRPLQDMIFYGNQPVNWLPGIEFECLCDSEFSCQTIDNDSEGEYDAVIHMPEGIKFSVDVESPIQVGRKFMTFRHLTSPVFCEEFTVIKILRFSAGTCPGSSGAKVLFLKNVPAVGFTHSEAFDLFNQSGSGYSCQYRHMEI